MVELTWYQANSMEETTEKLWYVRPVPKETLNIHEMAMHMAEHNSPFSSGTIEGILIDFVKCVREQLLNGRSVKIDDLAIFKISVRSNGFKKIADIDPNTGDVRAQAKIGSAVKQVKLLTLPSGQFSRAELGQDVRFSWDTASRVKIDAERKKIVRSFAPSTQDDGE